MIKGFNDHLSDETMYEVWSKKLQRIVLVDKGSVLKSLHWHELTRDDLSFKIRSTHKES